MYEKYMSSYLIDGYKNNNYELSNIKFDGDIIYCDVSFSQINESMEFDFHVSATDVFVVIQQLVCMYSAVINDMKGNRKEVLLNSCNLDFESMITSKTISVKVRIIEKKRNSKLIAYQGDYEINDRASSGSAKFVQLL